eukprot:403343798
MNLEQQQQQKFNDRIPQTNQEDTLLTKFENNGEEINFKDSLLIKNVPQPTSDSIIQEESQATLLRIKSGVKVKKGIKNSTMRQQSALNQLDDYLPKNQIKVGNSLILPKEQSEENSFNTIQQQANNILV